MRRGFTLPVATVPDLALEQQLHVLCHQRGERVSDLDQILERIRAQQRDNWTPIILTWFTDHTPEGHSRRIIEMLGKAFDGDELLTRNELFVLLAACYLHDLGMQDAKIDGRGVETMDSDDWDLIRERHPEWSRKLIIDRTLARLRDQFEIGLPQNSDFLEPIAIVAESHGSRFFEADLDELRQRDLRPGNEPARLTAVAALLLMGDELDLHRVRVEKVWPKDTIDLSPTGQLHFHLHHYITRVDVTRCTPSSVRRVELRFSFPDTCEPYRDQMKEWLARRLLKQIRRTNPVLIEALDGAFSWDEMVAVDEEVVLGPIYRHLPVPAQRKLAVEVADERIVGRTEIRDEIRTGIGKRESQAAIVGLRESAQSDARYLLEWTLAVARDVGTLPFHLDLSMRIGYDALDLPDVFRRLGGSETTRFDDADSPESLQDVLLDMLQTGQAILVVQNPSRGATETRAWWQSLLERIATLPNGFMLVIDKSRLTLPEGAAVHRLGALREKQIAAHLRSVLGYAKDQAERDAEALHQLAAGTPGPTLFEMLRRVTSNVDPPL